MNTVTITGDFIDGSAVIYKKEKLKIVKGLLFEDGSEKWFDVFGFHDFHCGRAMIDTGTKMGYINRKGEYTIEPRFFACKNYSENLASAICIENGTYLFDLNGKVITVLPGIYSIGKFSGGYARISDQDWGGLRNDGIINSKGELVVDFKYRQQIETAGELIDPNDEFTDGLMRIQKRAKYGFTDAQDNLVIPFIFDAATAFSNGTAAVKINDSYGFIDKQMNTVLPFEFQYAANFRNGVACVKKDNKWMMIDTEGNPIIVTEYDGIKMINDSEVIYKLNGKFGLINFIEEKIIPPQFDSIISSRDGIIEFVLNKREGVMDRSGKRLINDVLQGSFLYQLN